MYFFCITTLTSTSPFSQRNTHHLIPYPLTLTEQPPNSQTPTPTAPPPEISNPPCPQQQPLPLPLKPLVSRIIHPPLLLIPIISTNKKIIPRPPPLIPKREIPPCNHLQRFNPLRAKRQSTRSRKRAVREDWRTSSGSVPGEDSQWVVSSGMRARGCRLGWVMRSVTVWRMWRRRRVVELVKGWRRGRWEEVRRLVDCLVSER